MYYQLSKILNEDSNVGIGVLFGGWVTLKICPFALTKYWNNPEFPKNCPLRNKIRIK